MACDDSFPGRICLRKKEKCVKVDIMKLIVKETERPTPDSILLRFDKVFDYKSGQHGLFKFNINGKSITRSYSFNTSPYVDHDVSVTVRAIPGGIVSNFLLNTGNAGMEVVLTDVAGGFIVEPAACRKRHLIMFAGGSGITPIISMIRSILFIEPESLISLIYSNRKIETIIFKDELVQLEREYPGRLKVLHVITDDGTVSRDNPQVFVKGQLNRLIVRKIVKSLLEEVRLETEFYVCGPQGFMALMGETINSLNIDNRLIFKEHFYVSNEKESNADFNNLPLRKVAILWKAKENIVTVPGGSSILNAAAMAGLELPHSCTEGQCGVCRSLLLTGNVKMKKNHILSDEELKAGQVLLCQGYPLSDDVLLKPIND